MPLVCVILTLFTLSTLHMTGGRCERENFQCTGGERRLGWANHCVQYSLRGTCHHTMRQLRDVLQCSTLEMLVWAAYKIFRTFLVKSIMYLALL